VIGLKLILAGKLFVAWARFRFSTTRLHCRRVWETVRYRLQRRWIIWSCKVRMAWVRLGGR